MAMRLQDPTTRSYNPALCGQQQATHAGLREVASKTSLGGPCNLALLSSRPRLSGAQAAAVRWASEDIVTIPGTKETEGVEKSQGWGWVTEIPQMQQADTVGSIAPCTAGHAAELRRHGSGHNLEDPWCGQCWGLEAAGQGKRTQKQAQLRV